MRDTISQASFSFNRSIHVEARPERITSDSGALLLREAMHKLRIDKWLDNNLVDFRNQDLITQKRLVADLSDPQNLPVLHNSLMEIAGRNTKAMNHGRRLAHLTIDIDSLPIRVFGHQPGSQYNGHYHHRIYHPLIASVGQGGDLLGGVLRAGNVYTADNATDFVVRMLDQAEAKMCVKPSLRMDAGFPADDLLKTIEKRIFLLKKEKTKGFKEPKSKEPKRLNRSSKQGNT